MSANLPAHVTIVKHPGFGDVVLTCDAVILRYGRRVVCGQHRYGTVSAAERDAVRIHTHADVEDQP